MPELEQSMKDPREVILVTGRVHSNIDPVVW